MRLLYVVTLAYISLFFVSDLQANENLQGKVVEMTSSKIIVRIHNGQKKAIYLSDKTKFMHRPGSGEQSEPPRPKKNDRITAFLEGDTAAFIVVEEVPK